MEVLPLNDTAYDIQYMLSQCVTALKAGVSVPFTFNVPLGFWVRFHATICLAVELFVHHGFRREVFVPPGL